MHRSHRSLCLVCRSQAIPWMEVGEKAFVNLSGRAHRRLRRQSNGTRLPGQGLPRRGDGSLDRMLRSRGKGMRARLETTREDWQCRTQRYGWDMPYTGRDRALPYTELGTGSYRTQRARIETRRGHWPHRTQRGSSRDRAGQGHTGYTGSRRVPPPQATGPHCPCCQHHPVHA